MEAGFKNKYLKYKRKYLDLKNSNLVGGGAGDPCTKNHFCGDTGKKVRETFQEALKEIFGQTSKGNFKFKTPNGGEIELKQGLDKYEDEVMVILQLLEGFMGMGMAFEEALSNANR